MAYFKDLTRYEYSNKLFMCVGEPLNVGWLERCATYTKGVVGPDLLAKLLALCKFPVNRYRGSHGCHFCEERPARITDSGREFWLGDGEIRVSAKDKRVTYVAPNLIYHYVVAHQYMPPEVFLEALRDLSLPNPAVVWILEYIESFQREPFVLSRLLEWSLRPEQPSIPPELRGAVVEAANELKGAESSGPDAREKAEITANRLRFMLTRPD